VEFARWFVSQREDFRPKSKRGIAFELKLKGISEEITNEALVNYSEEEAIRNLAGRYFLITVHPLSFREFLELRGVDISHE